MTNVLKDSATRLDQTDAFVEYAIDLAWNWLTSEKIPPWDNQRASTEQKLSSTAEAAAGTNTANEREFRKDIPANRISSFTPWVNLWLPNG